MKTKNILLSIFSIFTFITYGQNEKNEIVETKTAVTEFKVESENLEELKTFDWNMVKDMFQENDPEQEITLAFTYVTKSEIDRSKDRVDNFEMKVTGKTADLDELTERLKQSFNILDETTGQDKKN